MMFLALVAVTLAVFAALAVPANPRMVAAGVMLALALVAWGYSETVKPCTGDAAGCGMGKGLAGLFVTAQLAVFGLGGVLALFWRFVLGRQAAKAARAGLAGGTLTAAAAVANIFVR